MIKEIVGRKLGMTQLFFEDGSCTGVTVVEIEPVCLLEKVSYPSKERVRIGCFKVPEDKQYRINNPQKGYFKKLSSSVFKMIKEVVPEADKEWQPLQEVGVDIFSEGEKVDISGLVKGRGFQGGMRRHNWKGQPKTHGSTTHRRIGSNGPCSTPGRVFKGVRMPGHMGNASRTAKNMQIVKIDKEKNVLFIKGSIPGAPRAIVTIKKH